MANYSKIHLEVILPKNRDHNGAMVVIVNGKEVTRFPVKGRGSAGPGNTVFVKKEGNLGGGNTPTGKWMGRSIETKEWMGNYGSHGAIRLTPIGGDALFAKEVFNRDGILIHGGNLSQNKYWIDRGGLMPTHGCLRVSNENMKKLMDIIQNKNLMDIIQNNEPDQCSVREFEFDISLQEITILVRELGNSSIHSG